MNSCLFSHTCLFLLTSGFTSLKNNFSCCTLELSKLICITTGSNARNTTSPQAWDWSSELYTNVTDGEAELFRYKMPSKPYFGISTCKAFLRTKRIYPSSSWILLRKNIYETENFVNFVKNKYFISKDKKTVKKKLYNKSN